MDWLGIVIIWIIFAIIVAIIAGYRGRNSFLWFSYGILLWPIALAHVLAAPRADEGQRQPCPNCAERIKVQAKICPHCKHKLVLGWANDSVRGGLQGIRWAAAGFAIVVVAVWLTVITRQGPVGPENIGGVVPAVVIGGPFELVDQTGRTVSDADFRDRWMLVYFGYTYCPDVCPTELANMAVALDGLGGDAVRVVPVFVTVDPERDTPAVLAEYVPLFGDRFVGLTGSRAQVDAAMKAYRVYAARTESPAHTDYLMDHSSYVYLMGPDGKFVAMFRYRTDPAEIAATIRRHMAGR